MEFKQKEKGLHSMLVLVLSVLLLQQQALHYFLSFDSKIPAEISFFKKNN